MKILKTVIATAIVLGSFTAVVANENVDTQIANIKGASAQERVQLMNEFKVKLAAMNAQDREDAINQLRSQVQTHKEMKQAAHEGTHEEIANAKIQKKEMAIQAMSQTDQMNQVQNMNQVNMMTQQQMGSIVGDLPMDPSSMPMSPGVLPGATGATMPAATTTSTQPAAATTQPSGMTVPTH